MKKKQKDILTLERNGEYIYQGLNDHLAKKYKADTPLDKAIVPYLIMFLCGTVDAAVFIGLFKLISYDSPFMLGIQVAGFLFAFDVVPIYIGIQLRRLKQGITKEKFILWLALAVCVIAFGMNTILNITTMEERTPDLSDTSTSYFGEVEGEAEQEAQEDEEISPIAISLTIFSIGLPALTSMGSFFISYLTYNPLQIRMRMEEEMLGEKKDEIRRLKAILSEYEADEEYAKHLKEDDEGKYQEMLRMHRALVLSYTEYVRERLKEHLANPAAISALSEETCIAILERLDRELAALYGENLPAAADQQSAAPQDQPVDPGDQDITPFDQPVDPYDQDITPFDQSADTKGQFITPFDQSTDFDDQNTDFDGMDDLNDFTEEVVA